MTLKKRVTIIFPFLLSITVSIAASTSLCWQEDLIDKLTSDEVSIEFKEYFFVPSHQQRYRLLYETLDKFNQLDQSALLDTKVLDHMGMILENSIPELNTILFHHNILENQLLSKFTHDLKKWEYPIGLLTQNPKYIDAYVKIKKIAIDDSVSIELLEFISQKMNKIHTADDLMAARNTVESVIEPGNGDYRIYSLSNTPELLIRAHFSNILRGEVTFFVNTIDKNGKKIAFGKELCLRLYNQLQRQQSIEIIRSDLNNLPSLNTNLEALNQAMIDNPQISEEQAAFLTPIGRWVKDLGYGIAEFVEPLPTSKRGRYKEAHILFHKTASTANNTKRYTVDLFVNNKKVTSETQYPEGFKDIYLQNLQATNPIDPTKLEAARRNINNSGFWIDTREPVYICANPEGLAIILNGHHRIEVMRSLQQEYIPGIYMEFQTMFDKAVSGNNKYKTEIEQMFMSLAISKHIGFYNNSWMPEMPWVSNQAKQDMLEHAEDLAGQLYPELFNASDLTINLFKDYPDTVERINDLGNLTNQFYKDYANASDEVIILIRENPEAVDFWRLLHEAGEPLKTKQNYTVMADGVYSIDHIKKIGDYTKWKSAMVTWEKMITGTKYQNAILGPKIGEGNFKNIYKLNQNSHICIAIAKSKCRPSRMITEIKTLNEIESYALPVVEIVDITIYKGVPAYVMKKYEGEPYDGSTHQFFSSKSIQDLYNIKNILSTNDIAIRDIQFLVSNDGSFVIADPQSIFYNKPEELQRNFNRIDELIGMIRNQINDWFTHYP